MKPIRIIDTNFNLLGEIDNYESMFFTRSGFGMGEINIKINRYLQHADKLSKGVIVFPGADVHKAFIIKHREIALDESGKASENWNVKGLSLKSIIGQRLTLPPTTTAYDNKQGDAETVIKHYVERNAVNAADPRRNIPQLIIAPNLNRGSTLSWQSRFKNLAEEIVEMSLVSGLGWNISLDIQNQQWVFDVSVGRDLTVNQSTNPPAIFSPQFDSLKSLNYSESDLNYKNTAYVAGQGEGIERRVIEVGDHQGLGRHELFIDARDVAEVDDEDVPIPEGEIITTLTTRGQQQLNEFLQEIYLEGQILTKSPFKYEIDYDLGDIVTIQNKDWGVTMDVRITEIKEIYEHGNFQIEATFGQSRPTLIKKIKQELLQISGEVRK